MPQDQSPRKSSKVNWTSVFFFLTLIITVTALYFFSQRFTIKKIEISSPDLRLKLLGTENFYDKNLFFLKNEEIKKVLIEANPQLKEVRVEKIYPDDLRLTVSYDQSISALAVDQGYFLLSPQARIISKIKQKPLSIPVINYYQKLHYTSYQTGDEIDLKDIATALFFLQKTQDLGLKTVSIDINGFNMIRLQLANKMILFTTEKSIQDQNYQLETLIRQFKVEGRDFKSLDFRFDKPIVILQ